MSDTPQDSRAMTNQQQCLNCGGSGYVKEPGHGDNCRCMPTTKCPMCKGEVALSTPQDSRAELRENLLVEFKQVFRLAPIDHTANCTNVAMSLVENYVAEQVAAAEIALARKVLALSSNHRTQYIKGATQKRRLQILTDEMLKIIPDDGLFATEQLTPHGDKEIE